MATLLGCALALLLGLGRDYIPTLFTSDTAVLGLVAATIPFVVATQPINALAFVWDGVLFGAGGFRWVDHYHRLTTSRRPCNWQLSTLVLHVSFQCIPRNPYSIARVCGH